MIYLARNIKEAKDWHATVSESLGQSVDGHVFVCEFKAPAGTTLSYAAALISLHAIARTMRDPTNGLVIAPALPSWVKVTKAFKVVLRRGAIGLTGVEIEK